VTVWKQTVGHRRHIRVPDSGDRESYLEDLLTRSRYNERGRLPEVFFIDPTDPWKLVSFKSSGRILGNDYKDLEGQVEHTSCESRFLGDF
jgi:hypothetical protein